MGNCINKSGRQHSNNDVESVAQTLNTALYSFSKENNSHPHVRQQKQEQHASSKAKNVAESAGITGDTRQANASEPGSSTKDKDEEEQIGVNISAEPLPPLASKSASVSAIPRAEPTPASCPSNAAMGPAARVHSKKLSHLSVPNDGDSAFYVIRKTEDVTEKYDIAEELGSGQFGVVSVAIHRETGKQYAIKSMSKHKAESDPRFFKDIRNEVEIMYHVAGHPCIVQLYEVYEDQDTIHLIMDLCRGGDWFGRLIAHGTYSELNAAMTVRKLLETLQYCHSLGVVHRDLKPENVLLIDDTPESGVKLADFGLSAMIAPTALDVCRKNCTNPQNLLHDAVGSAYYVAPEVLTSNGYGSECDIWSLGVVLYIVLGGYPPFDGENEDKVLRAVVQSPLRFESPTWQLISAGAKDMICRMLVKDPQKRASIPELLAHSWLDLSHGHEANQPILRSKPVPDAVISRLQQFAALNAFKKQARKVLAGLLPEEEVVCLLKIFKAIDRNKDGVITLAELKYALEVKGHTIDSPKTKELLECIDLNSDGVIDYEEFLAATVHQQRLEKDDLMYKAFQHFDRDMSGYIGKEEVKQVLALQGLAVHTDAIIQAIDTDLDGRINYEEFCTFMRMREEAKAKSNRQLKKALSRHSSNGRRREMTLVNSFCSRLADVPPSPSIAVSPGSRTMSRFHPDYSPKIPEEPHPTAAWGDSENQPKPRASISGSGKIPNASRKLVPPPNSDYEESESRRFQTKSSIRAREQEEDLSEMINKKSGRGLRVSTSSRRRVAAARQVSSQASRQLVRDASTRSKSRNARRGGGLQASCSKPSSTTGNRPATVSGARASREQSSLSSAQRATSADEVTADAVLRASSPAGFPGVRQVPDTLILPNCASSGLNTPLSPMQHPQGGNISPQSKQAYSSSKHLKNIAGENLYDNKSLNPLYSIGRATTYDCTSLINEASYSSAWTDCSQNVDAEDSLSMSFATHRTRKSLN